MSFEMFFAMFEATKPFDVKAYKRVVKAGQALASEVDRQIALRFGESLPDDVRRAISQAQLTAAINHPVDVLQHLARHLAMNGDFWAAGKLQATFKAEKERQDQRQSDRRRGARSVNAKRKSDKATWVEAAVRAGRRIRATQAGARLSNSKLAKRIVESHELSSVKVRRRPSWNTVRAELSTLNLLSATQVRKRRVRS